MACGGVNNQKSTVSKVNCGDVLTLFNCLVLTHRVKTMVFFKCVVLVVNSIEERGEGKRGWLVGWSRKKQKHG